eukprot:358636-Chlamydomonas_euryale.AAC.1
MASPGWSGFEFGVEAYTRQHTQQHGPPKQQLHFKVHACAKTSRPVHTITAKHTQVFSHSDERPRRSASLCRAPVAHKDGGQG